MDATTSRHVPLPCLAFNRGNYADETILYNLSEKKAVPCDIPELTGGKTTWATPHGWFLVNHPPPAATFLWNPSNGDKIHLPPLPENVSSDCTCLLSDKTSGKFVVLLVEDCEPVLWYCSNDGTCWARHVYDIGTQTIMHDPDDTFQEKLVITPIAACGGKFYFSTCFEELGVIEFTPAPAFSSVAAAEAVTDGYGAAGSARVFMVESQGDVYMVNLLDDAGVSPVVYDVNVYRMDFCRRRWVRVHDLGGQVFLNFGASRPAEACGMDEDSVHVWYPWEKSLLIYNVKEGTMKMEKLDGAPGTSRGFWMLPTADQ